MEMRSDDEYNNKRSLYHITYIFNNRENYTAQKMA
jgi:hypothetical protein